MSLTFVHCKSYGCITMETSSAATRTALDGQSIPKLKARDARQERQFIFNDADIAVRWLNGAQKTKSGSYERVRSIRLQLEHLRAAWMKFQRYTTPEYEAASREYEKRRAKLMSGKTFGGAVRFPSIDTPERRRLLRQTQQLHKALNRALSRYAFRPRVTYFEHAYICLGGMVADVNSRQFQMKINRPEGFRQNISEADAVMSLVRLDLVGEVTKVRLCDVCQDQWLAARKSDHHCCSAECRESFYKQNLNYHERKAATQRNYRRRLKERERAQRRWWTENRGRSSKRRRNK